MDTPEVRRRIRAAIERSRREAASRRQRADEAARDFDLFLSERAVPAIRLLASALVAEGHPFKVFTPAGSVRLASERASDDFIELELDTTQDPPIVIGRAARGRGRRMVTTERAIRSGAAVADLTDADVIDFVLDEIIELL